MTDPTLQQLCINTIRTLAMDAVQAANSGHPGMPMGCAPIAHVLFTEVLDHDPSQPAWLDRDRFVLSAGHGSMLLYAALHLTGYDQPTLDHIKSFRQWGSPAAGHPESHELAGVETTTGPLGQGFANGVGMALASERMAAEFNRPGHDIVDHRVYGIVSDGDLMEGISAEAGSLAGHLSLGRLVYLWDDNRITIDGGTDLSFSEDVLARFDAYGWHTARVDDGTDVEAIRAAIKVAEADDRPSLISVRTVIGFGSPNKAGTSMAHGSPLGPEEILATKQALAWPHTDSFTVPDEVRTAMDQREAGARRSAAWRQAFDAYQADHPELAAELRRREAGILPANLAELLPTLTDKAATRSHSGAVINAIAEAMPELWGGSADLAGSNNTDVEGGGDFSAADRMGRNLRFGIREHAMAAMANGMALHGGYIPYVATFLVFTDYCRASIRLSALMGLKVIYVMTHDSIGVGEDGPTHQPVEHVASLRAIPGLQVLRPADGDEVVGAWHRALTHDGPSVLVLTRQGLPHLEGKQGDPVDLVAGGAYALRDVPDPAVILVGTGSETHLALEAGERLAADGHAVRVVSLPSWEAFASRPSAEQDALLPAGVPTVAVEAGTGFGWERFTGRTGAFVGMQGFGASAPAPRLFEEFGITTDAVEAAARNLLA